MNFWRIYRLVLARIPLILGLMAVALASVLVAKKVADAQTQYVATAEVLPSPKAMDPGGLYQDNKTGTQSQTYDRLSRMSLFRTKLESQQADALDIATRPSLEQKRIVVRALSNQLTGTGRRLWKKPGVTETQLDSVLKLFRVPTDPGIWAPRTVTPALEKTIRDGFDATPVYDEKVSQSPGSDHPSPTMTDYISVSVRAPTPQMAQQIATLTAAAFVNDYYDSGMQEYRASYQNYADNQKQAKAEVDRAENALQDYRERTGIVDLEAQTAGDVKDLELLKQQSEQAQTQLDSANGAAATIRQQMAQTSPQNVVPLDSLSRPEVLALGTKIEQDTANLQVLATRYTPSNPDYQRAVTALNAEKAQLVRLKAQPYVVAQVNPQFQQLKAQEDNEQAEAARAAAAVSRASAQIAALQQSNSHTLPEAQKVLAQLQNAYDTAVANKKAADAAYHNLVTNQKLLDNGLISLASAAQYAEPDRSGPSLPLLLIYAALLSLVIGVGIIIGLDSLDNRIQTIGDAERLLGMPISAVIPEMENTDPHSRVRMIVSEPLSPVAESYRLLRTDLLFSADDKPFKSIMGATAKPGQGATTTICNLAVALAQVGKRVVLIDADLRRPKLHDFFHTTNETGLTSLLRDECTMEEALKITDIDNLLLLPSGPLPMNPSELLASQRMRTLHERLKPHTDFILVDTPSAIAFSDSAILASFMDAVLLVMRAQEAPRGGEKQVREMLSKARANVVGVVLNGVKPQLVDSYHYHAAYYPQVTKAALAPPALSAPTLEAEPPALKPGYEQTLMGVTLDHRRLTAEARSEPPQVVDESHVGEETTMVDAMPKEANGKHGFSLRSLFGTDDKQ